MYEVRLSDEGWSAKYWSSQWNTWFPCQDLVVGNIPNTKERSHQPTSDCNAPCSSKQGVKYSVLLFICYNRLKISLLFYVCLHVCICVCAMCTPGAQGGQKRVSDPQELERQAVVSRHVDAGNHTVRCEKSCRYSSCECFQHETSWNEVIS